MFKNPCFAYHPMIPPDDSDSTMLPMCEWPEDHVRQMIQGITAFAH
jgi:hypothetical protein